MAIVTRFAPSPNGPLHLGHALSAVISHDCAVERGGQFLLRIEDIDRARSRAELADDFRRDLEWLGLEWQETPAQSRRKARYDAATTSGPLAMRGRLYGCTCTRAEIAARSDRIGPDGPIYPGTCRGKGIDPMADGAVARLDVARCLELQPGLADAYWTDERAGPQTLDPQIFGDVVLRRKDGWPSYHLAVTLDDAADGVSLVTRGMDLFLASHVHRLLQGVLGLPVPRWHHHDLLLDEDGAKLAKRRGAPSLSDRRLAGEDGRALADALREGRLPAGTFAGTTHI